MWFILLEIVLTFFTVGVVSFIIYARWNYGTLEKIGIPVIKPKFLLGSHPGLHKLIVHEEDIVNFKKYGSIWGSYFGRTPQVFVCDPEILRLILVKDFDHFHDRTPNFSDPFYDEFLDNMPGQSTNRASPREKWKFVRYMITPIFTSGKLRVMSEHVQTSVRDFLEELKRKCSNSVQNFNVKELFQALVMDVLAKAAFGTKINCLGDPNNAFMKHAKIIMGMGCELDFYSMFLMFNPVFLKLIPLSDENAINFFKTVLRDIMKTRRESESKHNDLLDILLDAEDKLDTDEFKKLKINEMTLLAQAIGFILVGFDTADLTMSLLAYNLATYPEKQDALHEEIDAMLVKHGGRVDHDTIMDYSYLTACINESLRLYPPLPRLERCCTKDWNHENIHIKKGQIIMAPVWPIHRNSEYYEDPDEFIPERFLDKDKSDPFIFLPFGAGPRSCIGVRFGMEQIKISMIHILKEFSIRTNVESKLKFKTGIVSLFQIEPIFLNFQPRVKS